MSVIDQIAAGVTPPKIEDPIERRTRYLQLKELIQRQPLVQQQVQQQVQAGAMENQQRQQDLNDQQIARQAYMDSGGDMGKFQTLLMQQGASPKLITSIQQQMLTTRKTMAELNKTQLEADAARHDQAAGAVDAFSQLPPDQQAAQWGTLVSGLRQRGLINDQEASQIPQQYPGADNLKLIRNGWKTSSQLSKEAIEQQNAQSAAVTAGARQTTAESTAAKNTAELPGIQAKTQQQVIQAAAQQLGAAKDQNAYRSIWENLPAGVARNFDAPENWGPQTPAKVLQVGMTPDQQATTTETARSHRVTEGIAGQNLRLRRLEADPFGMMGGGGAPGGGTAGGPGQSAPGGASVTPDTHGDAFLQALPGALGQQVKALAEGRMAFPAGFALKSPYWQKMISMVSQYDPSFDAVNYNARSKTRSEFTSGKSAQQVNALNTVIGHLDSLSQQADKLNNSSLPAYNSVANWVSSNAGDPRVKEFEANKKAVVDELTRVWRGSGGSEGDIKSWADTLNASQSPAQMHGVIAKMGELLGSKIDALGEQYKQGMGTTAQGMQLLTPQAAATLNRLQGKGTGKGAKTAAPAAAVGPKKGDVQQHNGDTYQFDGQVWRKQAK